MEFFTFEPADFQVLEDIEFDETIQRPEVIRFFTLSEQSVDAFERMIPRGRTTKYQLDQIRKKVDSYEDLYNNFVVPTAETYELREPSYAKRFDWIFPIYASDDVKNYEFATSWMPLFDNVTLPNFYTRMLAALPKPYIGIGTGQPYPLQYTTEFLDDTGNHPLRALPMYEMTRTQVHEDKTIDIVKVPVQGTADSMNFKGYYLAKRPLEVPNPLPEHPFLKSSESMVLDSTSPLSEIVPSLDAILTHAVPVTSDPYGEGMKFLKIYDVALGDIPWSSWKSRFPPVEVVSVVPPMAEIPYPKVDENKPSEKLETTYNSKYELGLSPRFWLMNQQDGGELVIQMLKSASIENGSVQSIPGIGMGLTRFPETTLDDPNCALIGTSFSDFLVKGLIRRDYRGDKADYTCVPLEFIKQERAQLGYKNRKPWKETTGNEILKEHLMALKSLNYPVPEVKKVAETKTPTKEDSLRRREIIAIQEDDHRFKEDKIRDIQELLKETIFTNNIHNDADGLFVLCAHTMAILSGELAEDRLKFYDKWTARLGGNRVCKFCGEHINNDVLVDQEEYDENGYIIRRSDVMTESIAHVEGVKNFTTGLIALKPLFDLDAAMDSTAYLLLSVLQVLPTASTLDSLLKVCRGFLLEKFDPKKAETLADKEIKGSMGISLVVLLLQIHIPSLIPRRSFGSQPLKLSGFPRDLDKPEQYSIVDSMLFVLRRTFEAYPTSFRGPASAVVRAVLDNEKRKKIKQQVTFLAGTELKKRANIKTELARAAEHVQSQPVLEQPKTLLPVIQPPKQLGVITRLEECPSGRAILASDKLPKIVQAEPPLRKGLMTAVTMKEIEPSVSVREIVSAAVAEDVRKALKSKPKDFVVPKGTVTNLVLASRLSDAFVAPKKIRNIDLRQKPDVLRDVAQGFLNETLIAVQASPVNNNKFKQMLSSDSTLFTLTANYKEQKKEVNKLRARERLTLVSRLAGKNDQEREDIGELLKIGLAPYVVTNEDRILFAREAERLNEQLRIDMTREEEVTEQDAEIGVGQPQDFFDQGDGNADNGNYGDYYNQPGTDGRDQEQPSYGDDGNMPI